MLGKQQFYKSLARAISLAVTIAFALALVVTTESALAQTFKVLHTFTGELDGANPSAGLTMDRAGNLYGTAARGGATGYGTVFKLAYKGSSWVLTPLYSFPAGSDGASPYARVIFGPNGSLYGTTGHGGGIGGCGADGCGTVFNLRPSATVCKTALCFWTETVLHRFSGGSDGGSPYSAVVFDQAGNLYGTTSAGGSNNSGTVYKLAPSGGSWIETVLHNFTGGSDGSYPDAGLIFDNAGNLYGTTYSGGSGAFGTVFQLTPSGPGWTENILHNFQSEGEGGCCPSAGLILDSSGNLYGAASAGGSRVGGTVFELTPSSGNWTFTVLYSLQGNGTGPVRDLVMDKSGNLYGAAYTDGAHLSGSVFKLTPSHGSWTYTDLHDFTGGSDGGIPQSNLVFDASGNLYGTTVYGGSPSCGAGGGCGVVFEITL